MPINDSEHAKRISAFLSRFYSEIIEDLASESFVPHLQPKDVVIADILSDMASGCKIRLDEQVKICLAFMVQDPRREKRLRLSSERLRFRKSSVDNRGPNQTGCRRTET